MPAWTAPAAACDEIDADETVGAVVVQAEGESFRSGAHRAVLEEAGRDPAEPGNYETLGLTYQGFVRVGELLPPTIAAVRGHAVGAGVNLMLATDLRIVAESAQIISGFARIGIHPGGGHFSLINRLAGREAAAGLGVFGIPIDGRRAVQLGLAWEAVPGAEAEPLALQIAQQVAHDPALARATVRTFRTELGPPDLSWWRHSRWSAARRCGRCAAVTHARESAPHPDRAPSSVPVSRGWSVAPGLQSAPGGQMLAGTICSLPPRGWALGIGGELLPPTPLTLNG